MRFSVPDYMFASIYEITPDFLESEKIRALICDIDNTLVTYDDPMPTEKLLSWIEIMKENGIKIAFLSNNTNERVDLFNSKLGFISKADAKKPLPKHPKALLKKLGTDKKNVAMLGDQIFTDVWAGRMIGIRTIVVPPIKDKPTLFFKSKRVLEKPFIKIYKKIGRRKQK